MTNSENLRSRGQRALEKYLSEGGAALSWRRGRSYEGWRPDSQFEVRFPNGDSRRCFVEFVSNARNVHVEHALHQLRNHLVHSSSRSSDQGAQFVVFAEHLGRPMRQRLREAEVWFADLSGNRYFSGPGFFVDKEVAERRGERPTSAPGVFADRSSRLLRYLLPRKEPQVGVRELGGKVGISAAAVSIALGRLEGMGYLERSGRQFRLLAREEMLEEWVSFYRPRFRRQRESRYYAHARSPESIIDRLRSSALASVPGYGLSLHGGAAGIAPFVQFREVHLYVSSKERGLEHAMVDALEAKPAEGEANLVMLEPFYEDSFLFESRFIEGVRVVSDLQLYLDLSCFPQRGKEQADFLLDRVLRPGWSSP